MLRVKKGDYDKLMILSSDSKAELVWWLHSVHSANNNVEVSDPEVVISSDASKIGWGCECEGVTAEGQWQPIERQFHTNYLELNAAFFLLKCFQSKIKGKHVRLMCDNMTTVACVNHMGTSHSPSCNSLAKDLWEWCIAQKVWISAAHIPGVDNTAADLESRSINLDMEWKLNPERLKFALDLLGIAPTIDLFASRLNKQMNRFVAFRPDPAAVAVDAFSLSWKAETFYVFPPFSIVAKVLQKVQQDNATGLLVIPDWPTQVWYLVVKRLLLTTPVQLTCGPNLLQLPSSPEEVHPLVQRQQLHLLV